MQVIPIFDGQNKPINLITGLEWHPVKERGLRRLAEIREFSKQQGFDLRLIRGEDDKTHAGYAKKSDGAMPGCVSLAACVCDRLSKSTGFGTAENILAAIKLPNDLETNWAFVSSRDGVILADGDFAADENTVRERLLGDSKFAMGWDAIICPQDWQIVRSTPYDFNYFFETESRALLEKQVLSEVFFNKRLVWLASAAVVAGLGVAGFTLFLDHQKKERLAQENAAQATQKRQQAAAVGQAPTATAPLSVRDANPLSLAAVCDSAINGLQMHAGGWKLGLVECETSGLTVHWSQNDASILDFMRAQPLASINTNGDSATLRVQLVGVAKPVEDADLFWPRNSVIVAHKIRAETFGYAYKASQLGARGESRSPPRASQQTPGGSLAVITFEASARLPTVDLANLINAPGVRAQRIVYTFEDGAKKTITGVQYAK